VASRVYAFAFVGAQLLAMPGLAIALYLSMVGTAVAAGGWLQAVFALLYSGVVVLPMVLLCLMLLLAAGLFASVRPWACLVLVALNLAVIAVSWSLSPPAEMADLLVWIPTAASATAASALAWQAFRGMTS
jgi:hypothetical protein